MVATGLALLDKYEQHLRRRRMSVNTVKLRMGYARKFAAHMNGGWLEATVDDIEDFVYKNPKLSDATVASMSASVKSLFHWARRSGHLEIDPTLDLPNVIVHRKPGRVATELQIRDGLQTPSAQVQAMVLLGAECGLRVSEITNLHTSSRDGDWLNIRGKGGVYRTVHVSPELHRLLTMFERSTVRAGWYFPGKSGAKPVSVTTAWRWISDATGTNPHSLRHRAGTVVYRNGGKDIRMTQEFLGHSSPTTTAIYVHVGRDDLRDAGTASRVSTRRGEYVIDERPDAILTDISSADREKPTERTIEQ